MAKEKFRIPSQFDLGGITWTVEQLETIPGCMGLTDPTKFKVLLLKELGPQAKFQTFLHELAHCIMFAMGKTNEQHDEQFVDGFATFFFQYLKSAK